MNTTEQYIQSSHINRINTKWDDFAREVKSLQNADTFSMLYATDVHYIRHYPLYIPSYYKLKEMVEFSHFVGFDLLALTGDTVDGNTTIERQKNDLQDVMQLICQAKTASVLVSKGNHDDCSWFACQHGLGKESVLSEEDWYACVVNPVRVNYPIVLDQNNPMGGYCYVDYPFHKIRVINLNTNDTPMITDENGMVVREYAGQWNMGIREKQLKWLVQALTFLEDGWSVVLMSHNFLLSDKDVASFRNRETAWEIIQGFKNKTQGVAVSKERYFEATIDYDFTKNQSCDVLVYLCGHTHTDRSYIQDGITVVETKNILGSLKNVNENWDNPAVPIEGGWDCILIDKKKRILTTKRYSVDGCDRQIVF